MGGEIIQELLAEIDLAGVFFTLKEEMKNTGTNNFI
jgi:hypothetical protein